MSRKDDIKKLALAAATISAAILAAKKVSDDEVKVLMPNRDESSLAYLLGDGFGNLALAYGLINHANLDPKNINIYTKGFNEFANISHGENTYINFDNRFSQYNFKNTFEILKNIMTEEEILEINEKITKKESPRIMDLSMNSSYDVDELDEASKKKIYKLMLSPLDFESESSIEKYFLFSDFLNSNFYYYLASIYNLKVTSPVSELKEALLDYIGSGSYFSLDSNMIYEKLRGYLEDLGVKFLDGYKFLEFSSTETHVDKLVFEKDEHVEEVYTDLKDIISIESPTYLDNLYLGNTESLPENILNTYYLGKKISSNNIYKEIQGKTSDSGILYVNFEFSDPIFTDKIKNNLRDSDFFIFKTKSGISAKILGNKIILKVLNPNKNSIFIGDVFKALNGEDFFFELIKLFGLEDDFGELRFNLKSVSISMMENYKKLPGEVYKKNLNQISNLIFLSSKASDFGELYSVEKLVKKGIKSAHELMGIDHLEIFENSLSKMEILKFINSL
ncbi:oleate hydratase [Peptoniphilus genitalis]|uniref:oleate hydratase n=1 Tax=Peptoniphilus genitalis TaxID=3036303 RepID=UPI0024ADA1C2|nr:oleate hydratase [Peptoniphilus sp. Marseille-Q7072]